MNRGGAQQHRYARCRRRGARRRHYLSRLLRANAIHVRTEPGEACASPACCSAVVCSEPALERERERRHALRTLRVTRGKPEKQSKQSPHGTLRAAGSRRSAPQHRCFTPRDNRRNRGKRISRQTRVYTIDRRRGPAFTRLDVWRRLGQVGCSHHVSIYLSQSISLSPITSQARSKGDVTSGSHRASSSIRNIRCGARRTVW